MQRRLELACALVHEPALLFLDEPTAGIDPLLRETIWEELHRLRDAGRTLLVTTQYVNEAEECDQVALIADGRLIALAPPEELAPGGSAASRSRSRRPGRSTRRASRRCRASAAVEPGRAAQHPASRVEDAGTATAGRRRGDRGGGRRGRRGPRGAA